jgi:nucleoid DNA-binding protein
MAKTSRDQAVTALVDILREILVEGDEAHFPDLGTFHIEQQKSQVETLPTGETVLRPPCHAVVFTPDA